MSTHRDLSASGSPAGEGGGGGAGVDYALVRVLQRQVAHRLTQLRQERAGRGEAELGAEGEKQLTLELIGHEVAAHMRARLSAHQDLPDPNVDRELARALEAAIFGAGALQVLLDDPWINNIDANGADEVFVSYGDERGKVVGPPIAQSDEDLIEMIRTLASYAGLNARPFSPANPQLDLRLQDGSRLSAAMSVTERPTLSIRRHRYRQIFLAHPPAAARTTRSGRGRPEQEHATLLQLGMVDEPLAAFLEAAVLARCNIIVAGATDAGKTTLLRALIHCIPAHERLITVEKALELGIRRHLDLHPDTVEMEELLPGPDGTGGVSVGDLVRRSLRMNPSRVIVGEVLGPEVVEMLQAMTQGNDGSLSTIHASSAAQVFFRLSTAAGQHQRVDFAVAQAMIAGAIDFVVFVRKDLGGRRVVAEVLEVAGSPDGRVASSQIFVETPQGPAQRDPYVPIMRAQRLRDHGYTETPYDPYGSMNPDPPGHRAPPGYSQNGQNGSAPWPPLSSPPWER